MTSLIHLGLFHKYQDLNYYNSQVDELNQYGFDYKKIDHTTIKAIKLLSGEDLETDFSKPRENINSNDDADDKKNIVTTKKRV